VCTGVTLESDQRPFPGPTTGRPPVPTVAWTLEQEELTMDVGTVIFATMVLAIPVAIGAALARVSRPWWWGGLIVAGLGLAVCATDPEEGFFSNTHDHIPEFFLLCTAVMVCLVAAGAAVTARRRSLA